MSIDGKGERTVTAALSSQLLGLFLKTAFDVANRRVTRAR
jgi:hypothetical protein